MKKDARSIGIIGNPDDASIRWLEKELGKPIKRIEKDGKIILLVGRGPFKKKMVFPLNNNS